MRLNFTRQGEGPPLVLLHGLFGSSNNWAPLADSLSPNFDVITPDLRNHGRSPHHHEAGIAAMSSDILEELDALKLESVRLLGHSLGGRVAMRLALDHPTRVERLLVADMAPREYPPLFPEVFAALKALELPTLKSRAEADERLQASLPDPALRAFLLSNLARAEDGSFRWKMNLEALDAARADLRAEIKAPAPYAGPALFLRGGNSDYVRDEDFGGIKKLFPAATLQTLDGAGHWLHVDRPSNFADQVGSFFS